MLIQHLEEFCVLAESKNFTKAAGQLYISQPTLSKHIGMLEEELGAALLDRTSKGVELTPAGQVLLDSAQEILAIHERTLFELEALTPRDNGALRLDVFLYGLSKFVYPLTAQMNKEHPDIEIEVRSPYPKNPIDVLLDGDTDVAQLFRYPHSNMESLEYRDVGISRFCIGMPYNHRLVNKEHIYLEDLAEETLLFAKTETEFNTYFKQHLARAGVNAKKEILVDSIDSMFVMAENYDVVAPMQSVNLDPNYRKNAFRYIDGTDESVRIAFAWRKGDENPCLATFSQIVEKLFGEVDEEA